MNPKKKNVLEEEKKKGRERERDERETVQLLKPRGERGKCFEEPTDCESSTRVTPTHRLQLVLNNSTMHLCPPRVFLTKSAIAARDVRTCEAERFGTAAYLFTALGEEGAEFKV